MSQVASPYGLRVLKTLGEGYFSAGMRTYPVLTSAALTAAGIYFGDPVGLTGGTIVPLSATPTSAPPGVIGVFQGAEWQDPIRGYVNSQYLPANIFSTGATNVKAKVVDNPFILMRVQADGVLGPSPAGVVGMNAALGNFGQGSNFTGDSKVNLVSAGVASPAAAVRIVAFYVDAMPSPGAGSQPGDPFTDLIVTWCFGVHRYLNATGA
jgi:hypothetical protein